MLSKGRLLDWLLRRLPGRRGSDLRWWDRMADRVGPRAVLHHGHGEEAMTEVTAWQKGILFPLLESRLGGDVRLVLDFGCGPGRFTPGLADLTDAHAVGVDPARSLLERAPAHPRVEYRQLLGGRIPLETGSVDVVWVCLVLMCITDPGALREAVGEIERVLRPGGLLFLAENTQPRPDLKHLHYRPVEFYRELFASVSLEEVGQYEDLGERVSVLAGRRR